MRLVILIFLICFVIVSKAQARPEYALRHKLVNCSSCHVSPWGGGQRNINGKNYGSRGLGAGINTQTDIFSGDIRAIAFYPEKAAQNKNGFGLMTTIASANVPVLGDGGRRGINAVAAYNLGVFLPGLREAYLLWKTGSKGILPTYVTIGKVNIPFGLMTDEHRTFSRIQAKTSINDFEMGIGLAGDFRYNIHYDLVFSQGFRSAGSFVSKDLTWAAATNLRWDMVNLPLMIGTSGLYDRGITGAHSPYALSLYSGLSIDRLTKYFVKGSILAEIALARGWNDPNANIGMGHFIPSSAPAFQAGVKDSQSVSHSILAIYDLTPRWSLMYKLDSLALDRRFMADGFVTHGIGFKLALNSNIHLMTRAEKGMAHRPGFEETGVEASRDALFVLLHAWL